MQYKSYEFPRRPFEFGKLPCRSYLNDNNEIIYANTESNHPSPLIKQLLNQ